MLPFPGGIGGDHGIVHVNELPVVAVAVIGVRSFTGARENQPVVDAVDRAGAVTGQRHGGALAKVEGAGKGQTERGIRIGPQHRRFEVAIDAVQRIGLEDVEGHGRGDLGGEAAQNFPREGGRLAGRLSLAMRPKSVGDGLIDHDQGEEEEDQADLQLDESESLTTFHRPTLLSVLAVAMVTLRSRLVSLESVQ